MDLGLGSASVGRPLTPYRSCLNLDPLCFSKVAAPSALPSFLPFLGDTRPSRSAAVPSS